MTNKVTESDRNLGEVLAAARNAAKLTQLEAGRRMQRNQTWISRVEDGSRPPSPNELDLLINIYQPDDECRQVIEALRTPPPAGVQRGSRLDPKFMELRKLELDASEIFVLTSERMPMNLQSEQYTLMQYRSAGYSVSETDLFAERRRRQQVFTGANPAPCHVILAASALYRMPRGRRDLIPEQASYLLELIDTFLHLRLQVLPFDADLPYVDADMIILRFADKPGKLVVPFRTSARILSGQEVSNSMAYWRQAQQAALGVDQSRKFIHNLSQNGYDPAT